MSGAGRVDRREKGHRHRDDASRDQRTRRRLRTRGKSPTASASPRLSIPSASSGSKPPDTTRRSLNIARMAVHDVPAVRNRSTWYPMYGPRLAGLRGSGETPAHGGPRDLGVARHKPEAAHYIKRGWVQAGKRSATGWETERTGKDRHGGVGTQQRANFSRGRNWDPGGRFDRSLPGVGPGVGAAVPRVYAAARQQ